MKNTKIAALTAAVAAAVAVAVALTGCTTQEAPAPAKSHSAQSTPTKTTAPEKTDALSTDIPTGAEAVSGIDGVAYSAVANFADGQTSTTVLGKTVTCDAVQNGQKPAPSIVLFSAAGEVVSVQCSYFASDEDNDTLNGMDWGADG